MKSISKEIAQLLLDVKAVKLQPDEPFTWASGWKSPIYCDNRVTLSYPDARHRIRLGLSALIREKFPEATAISGVATGAIAQGALVAEELALPFSYIRSKAKDHGMGNQIEGEVKTTDRVVVVEDLISTGGSSLKAVEALREKGCEVLGMVAIYTHGFSAAVKAFEEAGVTLYTLTDYNEVIATAKEIGYVTEAQLATLAEWRQNPSEWRQ